MTVINNIEIDLIDIERNEIKDAIINNEPIEDKLHVISVISNPCLFGRRIKLFKEFLQRLETNNDIIIYIVETIYPNQKFMITEKNNPRHLQLLE